MWQESPEGIWPSAEEGSCPIGVESEQRQKMEGLLKFPGDNKSRLSETKVYHGL